MVADGLGFIFSSICNNNPLSYHPPHIHYPSFSHARSFSLVQWAHPCHCILLRFLPLTCIYASSLEYINVSLLPMLSLDYTTHIEQYSPWTVCENVARCKHAILYFPQTSFWRLRLVAICMIISLERTLKCPHCFPTMMFWMLASVLPLLLSSFFHCSRSGSLRYHQYN